MKKTNSESDSDNEEVGDDLEEQTQAALLRYQGAKGDIEKYNQLRFQQRFFSGTALCNEEKSIKERKMFAQLLSDALYQRVEPLPEKVYRGVHFSLDLARLYQKNIGATIYYNFTSTSQGFGTWVLEITLQPGKRDCVADVSSISAFPEEEEILIACNSGFRIDAGSIKRKRIHLTLIDQSKCLRERPAKSCAAHVQTKLRQTKLRCVVVFTIP